MDNTFVENLNFSDGTKVHQTADSSNTSPNQLTRQLLTVMHPRPSSYFLQTGQLTHCGTVMHFHTLSDLLH